MTISNPTELKAFLIENFDWILDSDYVEIMANTLGIYEYSKPKDLDKLLTRIDTHTGYLEKHPVSYEMPLFWVVEEVSANQYSPFNL
jgi:hypothetical protein